MPDSIIIILPDSLDEVIRQTGTGLPVNHSYRHAVICGLLIAFAIKNGSLECAQEIIILNQPRES